MSPPPPPLGRPRRRGSRSFDPALDDIELATVRDQLAQGRWTRARSLLAATGDDWDRRGHRMTVLAEPATSAGWAREWLLAEPDSADAATLFACAAVQRCLRGKESADRARQACLTAAERAPGDPTPWLALLALARAHGTEDETVRAFEEVRARHPEHHHAHHLMAARLAERRPAEGPDPLHEVYDFAAASAARAPADSPLALLPLIAHAERYRVLAGAGGRPGDAAASGHWSGRRAAQVIRTAFDWWLEWEREDHPRAGVDLNFLAHAKHCEGRTAEAAALFHRIGRHFTPAPWSYPDRDPYRAFHAARSAALGSV
ncbi:hypothetical protein [Streptomyces sp. NBC_01431]|uniref:hypothetical protein n=1 Tax=Streptomyces sp. NBC_01431 TaxID=2903863 RepID=UPI002E323DCE|nr:hypothetical protein [Streptomyces sp. NBC_01431]